MTALSLAILIVLIVILVWYLLPEPVARFLLLIERRRSSLRSKFIQVGQYRWHYLDGGTGAPLVLLHGIGADADNWTRSARYLNHQFRIIAPDLPGFGESDCPDGASFTAEAQARRLHEFTSALGLKSFFLAGNSMGGFVATRYARQFPQQVQALWLLAPGGIISARFSEAMQTVYDGGHNPLTVRHMGDWQRLLDLCFHTQPWMPWPVRRHLAKRAIRRQPLTERVFDDLRFHSDSLETIADGLQVPALIIWGRSDRVLDPSGGALLLKLMPNAKLILLDNIGHIPMLEQPAAVCRMFLDYATGLEQHADPDIQPAAL